MIKYGSGVPEHSRNGPSQVCITGGEGVSRVAGVSLLKNVVIMESLFVDVGACGVCEPVRHVTMV